MLLTIGSVLSPQALASVSEEIEKIGWRDGAQTAGETARQVKKNLQADMAGRKGITLRRQLDTALKSNPVFMSATRPAKFTPLIVSKTGPGGGYGTHVDNAFIGEGSDRVRTDISFTLFLSEPDTYEGGELVIDLPGARQSIKLAAGDLVLYPSTSLHGVANVTSGERVVCVGWIESLIPDPADRELLFDLENLKAALAQNFDAQSPERLMASKVFANLMRRLSY